MCIHIKISLFNLIGCLDVVYDDLNQFIFQKNYITTLYMYIFSFNNACSTVKNIFTSYHYFYDFLNFLYDPYVYFPEKINFSAKNTYCCIYKEIMSYYIFLKDNNYCVWKIFVAIKKYLSTNNYCIYEYISYNFFMFPFKLYVSIVPRPIHIFFVSTLILPLILTTKSAFLTIFFFKKIIVILSMLAIIITLLMFFDFIKPTQNFEKIRKCIFFNKNNDNYFM